MSIKQTIEELLARVQAIQSSPATADEGLVIRRVIEKSENNWNERPDTDNTATLVVKEFERADVELAADQIGLGSNEAVLSFLDSAFGESITLKASDVGTIKASEEN